MYIFKNNIKAGYVLHSAVHEARPNIKCVLHLHTPVVAAVSAMKCGLLPICQEALILGPIAYHDYEVNLLCFKVNFFCV